MPMGQWAKCQMSYGKPDMTFGIWPIDPLAFGLSGSSLPFDSRRWLGCDVVNDAVDSLHLIHNSIRDDGHQIIRKTHPVGRHSVSAVHGADRERVLVRANIAHYAYALDRQQHTKRLPDLAVESGLLDFRNENVIGFLQHPDAFLRDLTHNAHS